MKLIETIKNIINENKVGDIIQEIGFYDAIRYFGGYDNLTKMMGGYEFSTEEKIQFIKEIVTKLCEEYDDVEVPSNNLTSFQIEYDNTDSETQLIEYYSPEYITVERYSTDDEDYDVFSQDDFYIGSFRLSYEELHPSLITDIFYLMVGQI